VQSAWELAAELRCGSFVALQALMMMQVRRCSWFLTVVPVGAVAVAMEEIVLEPLLQLLNSIIAMIFFLLF
jgi:hypothetical protein